MHLIEILLPTTDNAGKQFPDSYFAEVEARLTKQFGGVTIFSRAPADGLWKQGQKVVHDEIVIFEVEIQQIDKKWWKTLRENLEIQFRQDKINIRVYEISSL